MRLWTIVALAVCALQASCSRNSGTMRSGVPALAPRGVEFVGVFEDRAELVPGLRSARAIADLHRLNWNVMIAGVAFLSVGTFLGGVWANESWGRYWGWDPKETWSLVTILVYAFVLHFRFVDRLNRPITIAAGSFLGISSVIMTYFGVNYMLSGLHSYAQGDSPGVPPWAYITAIIMIVVITVAFAVDRSRTWSGAPATAKGS